MQNTTRDRAVELNKAWSAVHGNCIRMRIVHQAGFHAKGFRVLQESLSQSAKSELNVVI